MRRGRIAKGIDEVLLVENLSVLEEAIMAMVLRDLADDCRGGNNAKFSEMDYGNAIRFENVGVITPWSSHPEFAISHPRK